MASGFDPGHRAAKGRRADWICWLLAFTGGFADAGSYVLVGSFTGHVTGNTVLTAIYMVTGRTAPALASATAVAAFLGGTALGTAWRTSGDGAATRLRRPLAVEIILIVIGLAALGLQPAAGKLLFVGPVCLSLGLQNGILSRLGAVSIHSTFITGLSTSLIGATLGHQAVKRSVLAQVVGCFVLGALCGAILTERAGSAGYAALLLPLAVALALTSARDGARSRPMRKILPPAEP